MLKLSFPIFSFVMQVHELTRQFFGSAKAMAFAVQRLYAWGALCSLHGPDLADKHHRQLTPYVEWVLGKNHRAGDELRGQQGGLDVLTPSQDGGRRPEVPPWASTPTSVPREMGHAGEWAKPSARPPETQRGTD